MFVSAGKARLEHVEGNEITEVERAVSLLAIAAAWFANGHPLIVGLEGGRNAIAPCPFGAFRVILSAIFVGIIRGLMVVPDGNERGGGAGGLEGVLPMVLSIAGAVVRESQEFAIGLESNRGGLRFGCGISARAVFVNVVADMDESIEIAFAGDFVIGVEWIRSDIRAAEQSEAHGTHRPVRQGFCSSHG